VKIQKNNSVMLSTLEGTTSGVWFSDDESKFKLPNAQSDYHIVAKYTYGSYPANPQSSDFYKTMMTDKTVRHLFIMPHTEHSTFLWNWANYPKRNQKEEVSSWLEAFVNARKWIEDNELSFL
jgi:phosphoribosylformylglycinamidine synthase